MKSLLSCLGVICLALFLASCNMRKPPVVDFPDCEMPAAPDYANLDHWAAHPDKQDEADGVPTEAYANRQEKALADVFFIHPTTFKDLEAWNGDVNDEKLNKETDESAIRHQASVFNGSCRVFAPRYRQMTYGGFFAEGEQRRAGIPAFTTAYADVKAAFQHYIDHENGGRPFILASHSQGTAHGVRLAREFLDGTALGEQLVAAYLVGFPFPTDTFKVLKPCEDADDTGCYTAWCTFAWDYFPEEDADFYAGAHCTNPVTWTTDESASKEENAKGILMRGYDKIHEQALKAKVERSILWVSKPDVPFKFLYNFKNYHIADFNLFWGDIRENVALRVAKFEEKAGR